MKALLCLCFSVLAGTWGCRGMDNAAHAEAARYLESVNGHAMLVYEEGRLVFERYFNGYQAGTPHLLASGTKSFSGFMAVAAQEDGLLSLDEKISATLTEWEEDPQKKDITLRQLLSLSSGIAGGETGQVPSYKQAVALAKVTAAPEKRFQYGPVPYQIFGEVMRRKLAASGRAGDPLEYLQQRLFSPLGMKYELWREDADKMPHLPSGAYFTAREWAKFGLLVLNGGMWEGRCIIKAESLAECFKPAPANPAYGMTFWRARPTDPVPDLVMAAGKGKQKLFIIPSRKLLIVQFADAERGYREEKFLRLVLGQSGEASAGGSPDAGLGLEADFVRTRSMQVFTLLDKDGDGRVTTEEAGASASRMTRVDADKDGVVTRSEAEAWSRQVSRPGAGGRKSGKK